MAFTPINTLGTEVGPDDLQVDKLQNFDPAMRDAGHKALHQAPPSFFTVTFLPTDTVANAGTGDFDYKLPWKARLLHVSAYGRSIGATNATINVLDDGTSVLDVTGGSLVLTAAAPLVAIDHTGTAVAKIDTTKRDIASGSTVRVRQTQSGAGTNKVGVVLTFQRL